MSISPVTKVDKVLLTREVAVAHSAMQALPGERDVSATRMKRHEKRVREGKFHSPSWAIARDKDGNLWRLDGQHTSLLLARCPMEIFPAGLEVVMTTYGIDSIEEDGNDLFEMFNHPDSVRTNSEKMGFYRARHEDMLILDPPYLVRVTSGYHYYLKTVIANTGRKLRLYGDRDRGSYLENLECRSFALWLRRFNKVLDEEKHREVTSPNWWMTAQSGIMAVICTARKDEPKIADDFWGSVIRDDGQGLSRELGRKLKGWYDGNAEKKVQQADYYRQALKTWEQYVKRCAAATELKKK